MNKDEVISFGNFEKNLHHRHPVSKGGDNRFVVKVNKKDHEIFHLLMSNHGPIIQAHVINKIWMCLAEARGNNPFSKDKQVMLVRAKKYKKYKKYDVFKDTDKTLMRMGYCPKMDKTVGNYLKLFGFIEKNEVAFLMNSVWGFPDFEFFLVDLKKNPKIKEKGNGMSRLIVSLLWRNLQKKRLVLHASRFYLDYKNLISFWLKIYPQIIK